ncbi:molecular chaperone [Iningainema tapete]|uniref:Molecular chaperone n=1 Tax=Iningainema tapete BLCC-T55 TaxID=2748662 RepID=A0A8J7CA84_9CYAN|nr:molecular chaperone [Iningainema tapete]MBD2776851.1 molecular chaperone [Iningainema tapete BLCC-T55]
MSVKIELLNRYQLRIKDNDLLLLPVIEIKPTETNLPHISRIDISVTGKPEDLAAQIQSVYKSVNFLLTNKLLRLSSPQRFKQNDCRWYQSLPASVNCVLQVKVEYFDSDEIGNPILFVPKHSTAECVIWTYPVGDTQIQMPVEDTITPISQIELPLEEKPEISYPGWFSIDFGTSNSTVTLYDPKVIVTPDSLPGEQEERLRDRLAAWLNQRPIVDIPGISRQAWDLEWQKFLTELKLVNQSQPGEIFRSFDSTELLEAIRQIEIILSKRYSWFRRAASIRLNQIYHEVFRVPPLEWQSLISVELDKDRRLSEIKSELEVVSLEPSLTEDNPAKVKVILGEQARQHRLEAIVRGEEIEGKFLHSPKRYFGQERSFQVTLDGKQDTIQVNSLLQAAYAQLIELTEKYRQRYPGKCSEGKFYRAVVTYPTIASPFVRREIETRVKNLGIEDVQMAYDEAISVAIFFLWREFGGDLNVGIESFKTRCRYDGDKWWQNVLVLDIGGGTTDLALIRLTLEEINPFEPGEDRGDGGRYYQLTPKLLGSSGHLQLGGELITLRLFLLLKAAIADCLLSAVTSQLLAKDVLKVQAEELSDRFLENGKFQPGKLLACVDKEIREGDAYKDALNAAEKVLPTRWKNSSLRAQTFYTLWEQAENAKIILGQKRCKDSPEPTFVVDGQKIAELLQQQDIYLPNEVIDSLSVTLTVHQFEKAVSPVIKEAIGIAQGLVENALRTKSSNPNTQNNEQVDWLILSGKTCNFELVERELYRVFSKSDYFVWNKDRVTFEPEYTKLATSAGACYAEKLRQLGFAAKESKQLLQKGANQLYIDVKNLFYFLPCSFKREVIGGSLDPIFHAGQELYQLQASDAIAKFRSDWQGMQLTNNIIRQDFENIKPQLWGSYNGDALMKKLSMNEEDFKNHIKVQFEINQKLDIDLLLCRGNPHYLISVNLPCLDAARAIGTSTVISDNGIVCDIAVNVAESANALKTDAHTVVFDANKDYSKDLRVFRYDDVIIPQEMGLITELPPFPVSGKHTFYFQFHNPKSNKWELIGQLPQPFVKSEYPCRYYVSLSEKGILRVHAFEVPYWTSTNLECLQQEGCVFRDTLQAQPNDVKAERDPFSGEH